MMPFFFLFWERVTPHYISNPAAGSYPNAASAIKPSLEGCRADGLCGLIGVFQGCAYKLQREAGRFFYSCVTLGTVSSGQIRSTCERHKKKEVPRTFMRIQSREGAARY